MSSPMEEAVKRPVAVIKRLHAASQNDVGVFEHFAALMDDPAALAQARF